MHPFSFMVVTIKLTILPSWAFHHCFPFWAFRSATFFIIGIGVPSDLGSILTFIIFCAIQVKSEYGWRRFNLDERRDFTDYSIVVPSGGWSGSTHLEKSEGADSGRVVDLGHGARW
ncbi:hypothetical protein Hanom_Chr04g00371841 [Helianthus anomalus]